MNFKISGFSTALYSTYWYVDPLGLLLDCGDGAATALQQKGRSVKTIACSHADRDHLTGLFRFLEVNSTKQGPRVLYPKDCGSFPAIKDFTERFDPHVAGNVIWQGISHGDQISLKPSISLEAFQNRHVAHTEKGAGAHKSLSFAVVESSKKLRAEFSHLEGAEIGWVRKELGEARVLEIRKRNLLTYSADTPIEPAEFWNDPRILIHEATFLDRETSESRGQASRHSVLEDVLKMASEMKSLEALILGHFSTRYSGEQIREVIIKEAKRFGVKIPVFAVMPGEFQKDILAGDPITNG